MSTHSQKAHLNARKQFIRLILAALVLLLWSGTKTLAASPAPPVPGTVNIAIGADTSESSPGWGGGSFPNEMVDGSIAYDDWAHGLAFTGGQMSWAGACGVRQAVISFGADRRFEAVRVWHHGDDHIPAIYAVEYWNGSSWVNVGGTAALPSNLDSNIYFPGLYASRATENVFPEVLASKVRFIFDNCQLTTGHGWIYEFEVFGRVSQADLTGSTLHYRVPQDQTQAVDGPLPVNAPFTVEAVIRNNGSGQADPFTVAFYLSTDSTIDSTDLLIGSAAVNTPLQPGAQVTIFPFPVLRLPDPLPQTYFGRVWLGLVIDPGDHLSETDEANNSNQGNGIDKRTVTLYDPILPRLFIPITFQSSAVARDYLEANGFIRPFPVIDAGWSRPFSVPTYSRFNGRVMSADAFRLNANPQRQGPRDYRIWLQGADQNFNPTGMPAAIGEPSPRWAEANIASERAWFLYVLDYHLRF